MTRGPLARPGLREPWPATRLTQLHALVDRLERLPESPRREWMLQEARARMVDVDTGDEPRPMRTLDEEPEAGRPEPPVRRASRGRSAKRPDSEPAPAEIPLRRTPAKGSDARRRRPPRPLGPASPTRTGARPRSARTTCCGSRIRRATRSPSRATARRRLLRGGEACGADRAPANLGLDGLGPRAGPPTS